MSYKDYIKNPKEILSDYEIYDEIILEDNYSLYKACMKSDIDQHYFLSTETFSTSPANLLRLNQLLLAHSHNLFHELLLFLSKSASSLTLYTISPLPGRGDLLPFSPTCPSSYSISKSHLFSSLISLIQEFHKLQIPYLELSPCKILVLQGSTLCLCPFRVLPDFTNSTNYYSPPEILAGIADLTAQFAADVWGLGCLYAELFVSITPLFQGVTAYEKLLRMFEVLGTPEWRSVEAYMTWETYKGLKGLCEAQESAFGAEEILREMLRFDPVERCTVEELEEFWAGEKGSKEVTREVQSHAKSFGEIEFGEGEGKGKGKGKGTGTGIGIGIGRGEGEERVEAREADNVLVVCLKEIKGLRAGEQGSRDCFINVAYEIAVNSTVHVVSDNFPATGRIEMNFSQKFHINSAEFKSRYRHEPIVVNLFQNMRSGSRKSRDVLLGTCEVYIGLLFSSVASEEKSDNSVNGWYNIADNSKILGQIFVEISTEEAFNKQEYAISHKLEETSNYTSESIKIINDDLNKLNLMLSERNIEKEYKAKV